MLIASAILHGAYNQFYIVLITVAAAGRPAAARMPAWGRAWILSGLLTAPVPGSGNNRAFISSQF